MVVWLCKALLHRRCRILHITGTILSNVLLCLDQHCFSIHASNYKVCLSVCPLMCRHVSVCRLRVMWHGGHFCQIQQPGSCCDVKGTVKRQPRGRAGTAALSALFPPWHTHTHAHKHRPTHTGKDTNTFLLSVN